MLKRIVMNNGAKLMNFQEVMKTYNNLICKLAHKYTNGTDFEDLMQEGYTTMYESFLSYDEVHCFSTHLTWQLRKKYTQLLVAKKTKMRDESELEIVYFDKRTTDNHNDYYNSVVDMSGEAEFESVLNKMVVQAMMDKLDDNEKDLLLVLMGKMTGADLARQNNVTRQNVSQQAKKLKNRLRVLLKDI